MNDGDDMSSITWSKTDPYILPSAILVVDVTEVYSPVRVNAVAARFCLTAGSSMDFTNGWDLSKHEHRAKALKNIQQEEPYCIIGSPPCTVISLLQELTKAVKGNDQD